MSSDQCAFVSAAGIRCHRAVGHDGGHKPYPIDWDLPADLADVLADPSVVVPQDAAVWEAIYESGHESGQIGPVVPVEKQP